ncbi:MAG: S26 family signal peptidase [Dehalococcoidia bacterium]|nr:S26 family signal peptidase [Dehalococcoidia bacterium]
MNAEQDGRHSALVLFLRVLLAGAVAMAVVSWFRRRFLRFEVAGESMAPAFRDGDFVLARRLAPGELPRRGDVVLARDPRLPSRTLLKRVGSVDLHGQVTLYGDNGPASTDSRHFGALPPEAVIARVAWRYWPLIR